MAEFGFPILGRIAEAGNFADRGLFSFSLVDLLFLRGLGLIGVLRVCLGAAGADEQRQNGQDDI